MERRDNENRNWETDELMPRLAGVGMLVISGVLILILLLS